MTDQQFWALAFISIVGIKEHPRNEDGADVKACARIADQMLWYYRYHKITECEVKENP